MCASSSWTTWSANPAAALLRFPGRPPETIAPTLQLHHWTDALAALAPTRLAGSIQALESPDQALKEQSADANLEIFATADAKK